MRKFLRIALHLPHDTSLGYFHVAVKDGGLGVTSFLTTLPRLRHNLQSRLSESIVRYAARSNCTPTAKMPSSWRNSGDKSYMTPTMERDGRGARTPQSLPHGLMTEQLLCKGLLGRSSFVATCCPCKSAKQGSARGLMLPGTSATVWDQSLWAHSTAVSSCGRGKNYKAQWPFGQVHHHPSQAHKSSVELELK